MLSVLRRRESIGLQSQELKKSASGVYRPTSGLVYESMMRDNDPGRPNNQGCCGTSQQDQGTSKKGSDCCDGMKDPQGTGDFTLRISKISGHCKAGEDWSSAGIQEKRIPVLSCEGPCVKGEIARRAAGLLPRLDSRFKRACHGETFFVPHSSMADWIKQARTVLMIDGCFLSCHGRLLENLIPVERIIQVNAHAIHKKHGDVFSYDDVPDQEIADLADQVARKARQPGGLTGCCSRSDPEGKNSGLLCGTRCSAKMALLKNPPAEKVHGGTFSAPC